MELRLYPRIVIAGLSGDSGKTILSCGLSAALRKRGLIVGPYKKGPDYIDPMWLTLAGKNTTRNLDTYLMGKVKVIRSFTINSVSKDISLIEGNRGLYDGFDAKGTHSTAELAKALKAPVIIVFSPRKVTRTAAAFILGCLHLDKEVDIKGVVLNRTSGRHLGIVKDSIEGETGIPVLGTIPDIKNQEILPSRHLGLITPGEYESAGKAIELLGELIEESCDIDRIIRIAKAVTPLEFVGYEEVEVLSEQVNIGYFYDRAFSFYYPENLEALEKRGAKLIPISSIESSSLPEIDALYIGGGFPETSIKEICSNTSMMEALKEAADNGLPIYSECGGLMYLAEALGIGDEVYKLSGILPIRLKMNSKPQGHGYCEAKVESDNPYFERGLIIRGHEFHYSGIESENGELNYCMSMNRGVGAKDKKDGLIYKNVLASYLHIHSSATPEWAEGLIQNAKKYRSNKSF